MQKISIRFFLMMAVWLIPAGNGFLAFCEEPQALRIAWDPWPPYQYLDEAGGLTGLDMEVASAVVRNLERELSINELPWQRILLHTEIGDNDIVAGASRTQEREQYAYFSIPYRKEYISLYVRKGESGQYPFTSLLDMVGKPFPIGIMEGVYYGDIFEQLKKKPEFKKQIIAVSDARNSLRQLLVNRVNGVLIDPLAADFILSQEGWGDQIERHPMPDILTGDIHFMLSRTSISLTEVNAFNESLKQLKRDGTLNGIMVKYLGEQSLIQDDGDN